MEPIHTQRYQDCLELYLRSRGLNLTQVEREMRDLGYADFHRRILYSRNENGERKPGWIEKYGWRKYLTPGSPPYQGGVAPASGDGVVLSHSRSVQHDSGSSRCRLEENHPGLRPPLLGKEGSLDFHAWLKAVSPNMNWDWAHIRYITEKLKAVTDGGCKRLMIFLPPRHGKSELVTVRYTAWRLTQNPKMNVILAGYNQHLANRFSRKIKHSLFDAARTETPAGINTKCEVAGPPATVNSQNADARHREKPQICPCPNDVLSASASSHLLPYLPANANRPRRINTSAEWETNAGGSLRAVGVGGGVTGFGADLIVIDDPVKSRAEAESPTRRRRLWEWYRDDIQTRLEPDAAVVLIQTRWHENDLAGRLLEEMQTAGDQWTVINLPALAERNEDTLERNADTLVRNEGRLGPNALPDPHHRDQPDIGSPEEPAHADKSVRVPSEEPAHADKSVRGPTDPLGRPVGTALCPDRFDEAKLDAIRRKLGSYAFSALYQQHPTPADGGIFKRAWFTKFIDKAPAGLTWKRGYDLAVSTKTASSYTASFRCAYGDGGTLYIDGGFRDRIEYPDQRRFIMERVLAEPDTEHGIELALHGEGLIQDLRNEPNIRAHLLRGVRVAADKITRALAWAPLAEEGKLVLVKSPWNEAFIEEACSFPAGAHDDQIDAVSLAVEMFKKKPRKAYGF
ncbi:MAG: phage terminase large subunit [Pyrinomonadaceae bacterium]